MSSNIKHTQLTRVGYTYQDYICVKLLIDWFRDPDKYQWVCIEGANSEKDVLSSIDDVIALGQDGNYSLIQVKFTIDSERDDLRLDFDWLLKKKTAGTSLLQKWQGDVKTYVEKDCLAYAALETNRKPDEEFGKCLQGGKINIDLIPKERLEKIVEAVGGYESAKNFFAEFVFLHSQPEIKDLKDRLYNQIVPNHATPEGWYRFLEAVQKWATHKNEPPPDGKITLRHLYELFESGIGRSLSQFFELPEGYAPPSEQFHSEMLERTSEVGGWVVAGLPGMGKSTYLSFLATELVNKKTPIIRHHYSLSTQSIVDRIAYPNVARSLQHQLQLKFPDLFVGYEFDADQLDRWLARASDHISSLGEKLVVIIDGLDHVSREQKEITQLEHLINRLLPFKDRLCLIFGTQPVSGAHLPAKLIAQIPKKERWLDLPAMDLHSIKCWVESLSSRNRLALTIRGDNKLQAYVEVSEALLKASGGYPLHIFYSLHNLSLRGKTISKYEIEELPACPDGDIYVYYEALWSSLSETARVVLLLIACVDFPFPDKHSIGSCFGNGLEFVNAYSKIQHLVETRRSGVFAFHSSILVFLRERQEFEEMSRTLLLKVRNWLVADAPLYWRWGWEWLIEARLGSPDGLIKGIERNWLIESICNGYPPLHIEHVISTAERIALDGGMYADLVRLRLLKVRLINGPEFQVQDYSQFMKCALSWSDEQYGLLWGADNLNVLDESELSVIGVIFRRIDDSVGYDCFQEIVRRIEFYANAAGGSTGEKIDRLIDAAIVVLCNVENPCVDKIGRFMSRLVDKKRFFNKLFDTLIEADNARVILDFPRAFLPQEVDGIFWDYFVLACGLSSVTFTERPERSGIESSIFGRIALILNEKVMSSNSPRLPEIDKEDGSVSDCDFCELFFILLAQQLQDPYDVVLAPSIEIENVRGFIKRAVETLEYAAFHIASCLRSGLQIEAFALHEIILQSKFSRIQVGDFDLTAAAFSFERALAKVSVRLHVVLGVSRIKPITELSMDTVLSNPWWNAKGWLTVAATVIPRMISGAFVDRFIGGRIEDLKLERKDTSQLSNESLELASLALALGRKEVGHKCLVVSAQHILGYGWRKDTTFSEVFDAIQYCSDYGVGNIPDWLRRVAPFVNDVFEFSEREIRHIPGWYLKLLAKHSPERLVDEFDRYLENQNWDLLSTILEAFTIQCDLNFPADYSLLRCVSSHECISELEKRAETDTRFVSLVEEQLVLLGGMPQSSEQNYSTPTEGKKIEIEISKYAPEDLEALYIELKNNQGAYYDGKFVKSWMNYWEGEGQGLLLVSSFEKFWDARSEFPYMLRQSVGDVFALSHMLQGKVAAYPWAVRDIRINNHWGRWSGAKSDKALRKYADIYSSDWRRLFAETIVGESIKLRGNEWILVPSCQLVSFLLAAGQADIACKVTEVMLASLEAEISHLSISPLAWYPVAVSRNCVSSKILLLSYKWPDRLIRRRVAMQIASLLDSEPDFGQLYLEQLASLTYEVDISDYLSILLLAERRIFTLEQLVESIKFPSLLSDEILRRIGFEFEENESVGYFSNLTDGDYIYSERFEKFKNGVAPIYYAPIKRLGEEIGYPLEKHMSAEWDLISNRQQLLFFNFNFFSGSRFFSQDSLGCSFSIEAEAVLASAYVRTIAFAANNFGMPKDYIVYYTEKLFPFCKLFGRLMPASKPKNWPQLELVDVQGQLPSQFDLEQYLTSLASGSDIVLCANGPVMRQISGVNCDLEIKTVLLDKDYDGSAQALYLSLNNQGEEEQAEVFQVAKKIYPEGTGRFETDFLLRGVFRPNFETSGYLSMAHSTPSSIEYVSGDVCNAVWRYWTDSWDPVWYGGVGPGLGTYLETSKDILDVVKSNWGGSCYMLAKLTILDKREYSEEENITEVYGIKKI